MKKSDLAPIRDDPPCEAAHLMGLFYAHSPLLKHDSLIPVAPCNPLTIEELQQRNRVLA